MKATNDAKTFLKNNPELKAMRTPHIRTIKSEFFMHEGVAEMTAFARLAWIGLWTQCDKNGRFIWRPKTLKVQILPFDSVDFEALLAEMLAHDFIRKYEANGQDYGEVVNWKKHQGINRRERDSAFSYPEPSDGKNDAVASEPCKHVPARAETVQARAMSVGVGVGVGVDVEVEHKSVGTAEAVLPSEDPQKVTNRKIRDFLKSWVALYAETYREKPTLNWGKETKRLATIFAQNDSEMILSAARAYLAEKSEWTTGHELGVFISQFNRWRTLGQREAQKTLGAASGKFSSVPAN